ncbi:trimeric intracellular cation channel family protein [Lysobacter soyae]|uniref:Trimeric intracellular cation channel family protein n=1 Tax=Lysobacter soyae TaxID=2764185 RepID=A0ABX8WRV3_9GAMM|nr:trimeric intracellular cation channel family protein [Lysobacter sp. CJ11]QYR53557.1 trimeric intracellular cation channel family protein [Lysobacter sp. CJ11]
MPSSEVLLLIADLVGTFVFALSGATVATRKQLDLFGVLVLSFAASSAGGICRDVLIGATPPAALRDWRYLAVAMGAGLITFFWAPLIERMKTPVRMFDAAGLGLFAVAGAQKALDYGLNPVMAALLGMLTGIGGGMLRDVLLADVPMVLRADLYAIAALAGATVVVVGIALGLPSAAVMFAGALLCFVLRMLAVRRGWHLPVAGTDRNK